jgi:hypothetical protein
MVEAPSDEVIARVGEGATGSEVLEQVELYHSRGADEEGNEWDEAGYRVPDRATFRAEHSMDHSGGDAFLGESVARLMSGPYLLGDAPLVVQVALVDAAIDAVPHLQIDRMRAMLDGDLLTDVDAELFREDWIARRAEAGWLVLDELAAFVAAAGGEVRWEDSVSAVAEIVIPERAVPSLVGLPYISAVNAPGEEVTDAGYGWTVTGTTVHGYELEDLIQSDQYYDDTYWANGQIIGVYESAANSIYVSHPAFEDVFGNDRVTNCTWSGSSCTASYPTSGGPHSTAVASVAVGDITAAQDAVYISNTGSNWRQRSGVARMAEAVGSNSMSYFLSSSFQGAIVNQSSHWDTDTSCTGADTHSVTANSLYESGVALFKSAANEGHSSSTDCTVGSPGSAIGAFTISGMSVNSSDAEAIYSGNARGGVSSTDGRGRTIIALTTPTGIQYPYPFSDSLLSSLRYGTDWPDTSASGPESFCCTSAATPVASGAAALFRDWYLDQVDTSIDDPGILYANMLLMGDRTAESGSRLLEGYDNLWGAGKLRLREFDNAGLDAPWGWGDGSVCVSDGAYTFVTISSSTLSSDVDVMRVVAWWYDRRHDDSSTTAIDRVSMQVRNYDSWMVPLLPWSGAVEADDSGTDNKLRVHIDNPTSSKYYRIRFSGDDVTSDGEGCGTDSMRVYYAWFYEDSDREAAEALPYIRPE